MCLIFLCVISCRKENGISSSNDLQLTPYLKTVNNFLQDSLTRNDYADIDVSNAVLSRFDNGKINFLRVPFKSKSAETNFVMLQTDSLGNYMNGSIISVTKLKSNSEVHGFNGKINTSFLNGQKIKEVEVINGSTINPVSQRMLPAPSESVTGYDNYGYTSFDLMSLFDQFYYYSSGSGGTYLPVGSGGGDGGSSAGTYYGYYTQVSGGGGGGSTIHEIEFDHSESEPAENISKIFNCFNNISNAGATYSLKLCSDVPDNASPYSGFDNRLHPGHTFLILTKTNGTQSITKAFGFYPNSGYKSIFFEPVSGKIVNDADHEINASIEINNLTQSNFNSIKSKAIADATKSYDLDDFNCSDFALDVFNVIRPTNPIILTPFVGVIVLSSPPIVVTKTINNSPQMLFSNLSTTLEQYGMHPDANTTVQLNFQGTYHAPYTTGGCN